MLTAISSGVAAPISRPSGRVDRARSRRGDAALLEGGGDVDELGPAGQQAHEAQALAEHGLQRVGVALVAAGDHDRVGVAPERHLRRRRGEVVHDDEVGVGEARRGSRTSRGRPPPPPGSPPPWPSAPAAGPRGRRRRGTGRRALDGLDEDLHAAAADEAVLARLVGGQLVATPAAAGAPRSPGARARSSPPRRSRRRWCRRCGRRGTRPSWPPPSGGSSPRWRPRSRARPAPPLCSAGSAASRTSFMRAEDSSESGTRRYGVDGAARRAGGSTR